jgi:endonuclease-8
VEEIMEGPSLVILREELKPFVGKKVVKVRGNTKQPKDLLKGRELEKVETWAKVLFLTFSKSKVGPHSKKIITKTHFLMFGSYRIDDPKENRVPRLELKFENGTVYFYTCSILFDADEYLEKIDREVDVMSPAWSEKHVLQLMKKKKKSFLCDIILDQTIFAGAGNIVKNEVLFNIRRDPMTLLSQVPQKDWPRLAYAVRDYCFHFYQWKKKFELKKHWQVYRQQHCPLCESRLCSENTGKLNRKSFYCPNCQKLPVTAKKIKVFPVLPLQKPGLKDKHFDH